MKIAIGCDEVAYELKEAVKAYLIAQTEVPVEEVVDFGVYDKNPIDYPDTAEKAALSILKGECQRGILICGTGIGMAIAANKVPGIRAAQVWEPYGAERARKSNDAQIMTLGALVTGLETAKALVSIWLKCEFAGGRSAPKVEKLKALDEKYKK